MNTTMFFHPKTRFIVTGSYRRSVWLRLNQMTLLAALSGFALLASAADPVSANCEAHPTHPLPSHDVALSPAHSALTTSLVATGEYWTNLHGGAQTGSRWNTLVDLGMTVDLERLGAAHDSSLVGQVFWVENQNAEADLSALTGAFNPVSNVHAGNQLRVFNLHYRQAWNNDAVVLKLGQLAIDDDFMCSEYACLFANSAFGAMPSQMATPLATSAGSTAASPAYPVAAPGLFVSARASNSVSWQLGIYHGGPGPDEKQNHGFDWESSSAAGAVAFLETAWSSTLAGHASTLRLGGAYHTGRFDDFSALNQGATASTVRGLYSIYVGLDSVLAADADGRPSFAAFCRAGLSPQQDRSVVKTYVDTGINWFGPLAARPDDSAGLAFSWTEFGRSYRAYTGIDVLARAETTVELTYRAPLTARWVLQADLQLLGCPADETATGSHRTATVAGLRTELSF